MGKGFAYFSAAVVTLILIKDGTLGGLFNDVARFGGDAAKGLKPITTIA